MKLTLNSLSKSLLMISVIFFSAFSYAAEKLKIVPHKEVCMVNDTHFGRPQIPVAYEGKTYYGCCENCKKTLSENTASRTTIDPISGKPVDKAAAVIAAKEDGTVLYFENQKNFNAYQKKSPEKKN